MGTASSKLRPAGQTWSGLRVCQSGRCVRGAAVNKGGQEHDVLVAPRSQLRTSSPRTSRSSLGPSLAGGTGWRSSLAPEQETNAPSGGKDPEDGAEKPWRNGLCCREADKEKTKGREKRVLGQVERLESEVQHLGAGGEHPRSKAHQGV